MSRAPALVAAQGVLGRVRPTLLRHLLVERHWQTPRTFRHQFLRAAKELGDRDDDPALRTLDVSVRNFQRWLTGARPRPDACRVLEHMFGIPVDRLIEPADADHSLLPPSTGAPRSGGPRASAGQAASRAMPPEPAVLSDLPAVQVTVRPGTAVTVLCQDGEAAWVAVVAGPVRVLIETPTTHRDTPAVLATDDESAVRVGARVYSLDAARFNAREAAG